MFLFLHVFTNLLIRNSLKIVKYRRLKCEGPRDSFNRPRSVMNSHDTQVNLKELFHVLSVSESVK